MQMTVITGVERRRTWTDDQKLALIEATMEPGANVAEIARAADIQPAQLYRWRKELLDPEPEPESGFTPVVIDNSAEQPSGTATSLSSPAIQIEIAGAIVRIAADAPPILVTAALRGLRV